VDERNIALVIWLITTFLSTRLSREWLAANGFDSRYGARPMSRLIHEKIKQPLANEILFGKLAALSIEIDFWV